MPFFQGFPRRKPLYFRRRHNYVRALFHVALHYEAFGTGRGQNAGMVGGMDNGRQTYGYGDGDDGHVFYRTDGVDVVSLRKASGTEFARFDGVVQCGNDIFRPFGLCFAIGFLRVYVFPFVVAVIMLRHR